MIVRVTKSLHLGWFTGADIFVDVVCLSLVLIAFRRVLFAAHLFDCARSVGLLRLSPSRCVPLGEKGMRKIPLVTELSVFQKTLS